MIRIAVFLWCVLSGTVMVRGQSTTGSLEHLWEQVPSPSMTADQWKLPGESPEFSASIVQLVKKHGLDAHTSAEENPDKVEAWGSICVVDLRERGKPVVGGWEIENFVYPASSYKMYVLGELIRQVCAGERSLDDFVTVSEHNVREGSKPQGGQVLPLAEVLRLMCAYSDNTAANVAIDVADRRRVSALIRALGCEGSEVTRKFLPRSREDDQFSSAPATVSCGLHFAQFLYAVEQGAIGGGKGRGLIKGFLGLNEQNGTRIRAGLPATATVYSKTGEWNTFTTEAALVEDGPVHYVLVVMTVQRMRLVAPKIAAFARDVHALLKHDVSGS